MCCCWISGWKNFLCCQLRVGLQSNMCANKQVQEIKHVQRNKYKLQARAPQSTHTRQTGTYMHTNTKTARCQHRKLQKMTASKKHVQAHAHSSAPQFSCTQVHDPALCYPVNRISRLARSRTVGRTAIAMRHPVSCTSFSRLQTRRSLPLRARHLGRRR